jgi:ribonuclease BN (tRNA processing enzyme)
VVEDTRLVVLGGRGSIAVAGPQFVRYGGNTSSFALAVGRRIVAFIDAGTGMVSYRFHGLHLAPSLDVFLTHYHWDHIQGLSMLDAVWAEDGRLVIHGPGDPRGALTAVITPPWFPVSLAEAPGVHCETIGRSTNVSGMVVTPFEVEHPQGAVGYRIDGPTRSLAIVTDHEAGTGRDRTVADAIRGVDVLVHDAQYAPSESSIRRGWGHSTWEGAVTAAEAAGAGRLILTSLDPRSTDDDVDGIVEAVRRRFPDVGVAAPGVEVRL